MEFELKKLEDTANWIHEEMLYLRERLVYKNKNNNTNNHLRPIPDWTFYLMGQNGYYFCMGWDVKIGGLTRHYTIYVYQIH